MRYFELFTIIALIAISSLTKSIPNMCWIRVIAFYDFNGNGEKELTEPLLGNITIRTSLGIWMTDKEGVAIVDVPCWSRVIEVIIPEQLEKFKYVTWSEEKLDYIPDNRLLIMLKSLNTTLNLPLAQGFLTFPLDRVPMITSPFREPRPGARPPYHLGTDFKANIGERVFSPAPGRILSIYKDENYGECILIEISDLKRHFEGEGEAFLYVICHINVVHTLKKGDFVKRGQLIGYVSRPNYAHIPPHIHFQVMGVRYVDNRREITVLSLYEEGVELYTSTQNLGDCKLRPVKHPSLWTAWNHPVHYHIAEEH